MGQRAVHGGLASRLLRLEPKVLRILNALKKVGIEHRVNEQHEATLAIFKVWIFYFYKSINIFIGRKIMFSGICDSVMSFFSSRISALQFDGEVWDVLRLDFGSDVLQEHHTSTRGLCCDICRGQQFVR